MNGPRTTISRILARLQRRVRDRRALPWPVVVCSVVCAICAGVLCVSCGGESDALTDPGKDPQVTTLGSIEVTARLVEIPEGAIFKRDLYNYATILKYEVLKVHRGEV
jgi:hypothetical protein